ncbi:nitrogen fixation protein NifX [Alteromonadaceae bacterium 2753L.S.0a.02]|nr:nitrogen fixation protein NifX [Alteromonadaceae bacterium 2753L.S.0a.02]
MNTQPLNDEVALRIGLAVRELETVETTEFLKLLIRIMGEPITPAKLDKLRAKKVKSLAGEMLEGIDSERFEKSFALLKGRGIRQFLNPKPEFEQGVFCEIKGSIRVACASNSGENIDAQFSDCVRFLIYQVSPEYIRLIDIREPSQNIKGSERAQKRATLLEDCALLYTTAIGAQATAKVVKVGLHPIKLDKPVLANEALLRLQGVLSQDNPPPWLLKAMGKPSIGVKLYGENVS